MSGVVGVEVTTDKRPRAPTDGSRRQRRDRHNADVVCTWRQLDDGAAPADHRVIGHEPVGSDDDRTRWHKAKVEIGVKGSARHIDASARQDIVGGPERGEAITRVAGDDGDDHRDDAVEVAGDAHIGDDARVLLAELDAGAFHAQRFGDGGAGVAGGSTDLASGFTRR